MLHCCIKLDFSSDMPLSLVGAQRSDMSGTFRAKGRFIMPNKSPAVCAAFQQLEVDYCAGKPDSRFAAASQAGLNVVPIVRIYGVTDKGAIFQFK